MSICDATTLDRISRPSATTAAAVSSHDDSIPRIRTLILGALAPNPMLTRALLLGLSRHATYRKYPIENFPPFDVEHLFGLRFGGRQKSRAQPCCGQDPFAYFFDGLRISARSGRGGHM